jgi:uncharacterized protein
MLDLGKIKGFEWDSGNIDKSYKKHGVTPNEAEKIFLDKDVVLQEDIKHTQDEERSIAIGKTRNKQVLFVVFTVRNKRVRIISARRANKKEWRQYEET